MRKIAFFLAFTVILAQPPQQAKAIISWPDIGNAILSEGLAFIKDLFKEVIIGAVKQAALQKVASALDSAGGKGEKYIRNYADFLVQDPKARADDGVMKYIRDTVRGKTGLDYRSISNTSNAYIEYLERNVRKSVGLESNSVGGTTIDQHCNSYDVNGMPQFFGSADQPNFACFDAFWQPNNNPILLGIQAQTVREQIEQSEKEIALAKATGTGILPTTDKSGDVIQPVSVIEALQKAPVDLYVNAAASEDGTFATAIVAAITAKAINKIVAKTTDNPTIRNAFEQAGAEAVRNRRNTEQSQGPAVIFNENAVYGDTPPTGSGSAVGDTPSNGTFGP